MHAIAIPCWPICLVQSAWLRNSREVKHYMHARLFQVRTRGSQIIMSEIMDNIILSYEYYPWWEGLEQKLVSLRKFSTFTLRKVHLLRTHYTIYYVYVAR